MGGQYCQPASTEHARVLGPEIYGLTNALLTTATAAKWASPQGGAIWLNGDDAVAVMSSGSFWRKHDRMRTQASSSDFLPSYRSEEM